MPEEARDERTGDRSRPRTCTLLPSRYGGDFQKAAGHESTTLCLSFSMRHGSCTKTSTCIRMTSPAPSRTTSPPLTTHHSTCGTPRHVCLQLCGSPTHIRTKLDSGVWLELGKWRGVQLCAINQLMSASCTITTGRAGAWRRSACPRDLSLENVCRSTPRWLWRGQRGGGGGTAGEPGSHQGCSLSRLRSPPTRKRGDDTFHGSNSGGQPLTHNAASCADCGAPMAVAQSRSTMRFAFFFCGLL
jgi:hypothetical protein